MKRSTNWTTGFIGLVLLTICHAAVAQAGDHKIRGTIPLGGKSKSEYAALAKLSLQEAMAKISAVAPGKFVEIALEEVGGFLTYEAEVVATDKSRREIVIDAGTGEVLLVKEIRKKA